MKTVWFKAVDTGSIKFELKATLSLDDWLLIKYAIEEAKTAYPLQNAIRELVFKVDQVFNVDLQVEE